MSNEPTLIATLPAGRYIVGDPCYSIGEDHADWMVWLEAADYTQTDRRHVLVADYKGSGLCVGVSTAFGDGCYEDNLGNAHPVDAGMIGVVPVVAADSESVPPVVVDFPDEFDCYYDDGTIHLGHIVIYTGDRCEDCEEPISGGMLCDNCEYERERLDEDECEHCGSTWDVTEDERGFVCQDCRDEMEDDEDE